MSLNYLLVICEGNAIKSSFALRSPAFEKIEIYLKYLYHLHIAYFQSFELGFMIQF
jgi:hypothetical protein